MKRTRGALPQAQVHCLMLVCLAASSVLAAEAGEVKKSEIAPAAPPVRVPAAADAPEELPPDKPPPDASANPPPTREAETAPLGRTGAPAGEPQAISKETSQEGATTAPDASASPPQQDDLPSPPSPAARAPLSEEATAAPPASTPDRTGPRRLFGLLGPGIGFGFFYPQGVNDYLEYRKDLQGAEVETGTTAIYYNMVPKVAFDIAPIEYVQFQLVGEIGWAPKFIGVSGGDSGTFHYLRYSGGGTVNGHLPLKGGKYSVFLGAGALFHYLRFEGYSAWAPGARGVAGFRFYRKRVVPEVFLAFDWVRSDSREKIAWLDPVLDADGNVVYQNTYKRIELNYTGITLGINVYFQLFGQ
jgi:hypothetical protein